jgi:hypothetical protein
MTPFLKSVALGTLAGGAMPSVFTCTIALMAAPSGQVIPQQILPLVGIALLPAIIAFVLVLGSSVLFGLPFTRLLQARDWESSATYIIGGVGLGFAVPILVLLTISAPSGYWLAILGGFSGGITANTWWREAREPNVR